jgi:tetratricopeptide (TPR) repeat protein
LLIALLSGCAGNAPRRHDDPLIELSRFERAPVLDPAALADVDALALDEEATRFIEERTAGIDDPYEKVRALRSAVFDDDGLGFVVDKSRTFTAQEAFDHGGGNCLSLANLFVAAARHLGIDAVFQVVEPRKPRASGSLSVVEQHINVSGALVWQGQSARYVLDYLAVPEVDFNEARIISDRRALAHYYNNIAMEQLSDGEIEIALQYLKKAALTDGEVDFVWSNLGVVYRWRADRNAAVYAYQHALSLEGGSQLASRNLAFLLRRERDAGRARF